MHASQEDIQANKKACLGGGSNWASTAEIHFVLYGYSNAHNSGLQLQLVLIPVACAVLCMYYTAGTVEPPCRNFLPEVRTCKV